MAFNFSPRIITDGLVLHLDAANQKSYPRSGTVWSDLSRGRNNGTLINGPIFDNTSGGNILFDGTNDRVTISPNTPLRFAGGTNTYTIDCVFRIPSTHVRSNPAALFDFYRYGLYYEYANNVRLTYVNKGFDDTSIYSATNIYGGSLNAKNNWNHIIFTYTPTGDTATITNLTNGVFTSTSVTRMSNSYDLTNAFIGNTDHLGGTYYNFEGNIAQLKIYNVALTLNQMIQNFNATKGRYGI